MKADIAGIKDDIADVKNQMATKDELAALKSEMASKNDLRRLETCMASSSRSIFVLIHSMAR